MKARTKLLILLAVSIVVMVGFALWKTTQQHDETRKTGNMSAETKAMATSMSPANTIPDSDNVSSQYHAQVEGLEKRLESAPDDTTHLIRLAQLYQDGHQADKAIPHYKHYLKLHPKNHQAWLDLATCYGKQDEWQNALMATEQLLKIYPDDVFGRYNLGAIHANLGQFNAAKQIWTQLTILDNNPHVVAMAKQSLQQLDQMSTGIEKKSN